MGIFDDLLRSALGAEAREPERQCTTTGRSREGADAAGRAIAQSDEWGFTAYADWLGAHRERLGF